MNTALGLIVPCVLYAVCYTAGYLKANIVFALGAFTIAQFFFSVHWDSLVTAVIDIVPITYRGTCQSFLPLCQMIMGSFAPLIVRALSDRISLPLALLFCTLAICLGASLLLLLTCKNYNADYEKKGTVRMFKLERI